ncbi:GNAT family N-acetyltransferase [Noviherbaspirillum saxi]|uniref:N-acetyltransferase n=1 Tax=Noviherbaspirillum saxi TaxID=2320863 RepID=A0A3A3FL65_9BURK|nr:GNAT family N-acetyltransferase [Noviherbaspirillum saxi]RJF96278.1 N-acetyltransferase [Noviherbaspirillum saxi]
MNQPILHDNADARRYELIADGNVVGFAQYMVDGDTVTIVHTEILPQHEGKGYGSALARQTLEQVRATNRNVMPACEFIASYIDRHAEYEDLVADRR